MKRKRDLYCESNSNLEETPPKRQRIIIDLTKDDNDNENQNHNHNHIPQTMNNNNNNNNSNNRTRTRTTTTNNNSKNHKVIKIRKLRKKKRRKRRGKMKLKIKKFEITRPPENFFPKTWSILSDCIRLIFLEQDSSTIEKESLYRKVENLVLHKFSEKLFTRLSDDTLRHIKERIYPKFRDFKFLKNKNNNNNNNNIDVRFLRELIWTWEIFTEKLKVIQLIFTELESHIHNEHPEIRSIKNLCLSQFREIMFLNEEEDKLKIQKRVTQNLVNYFHLDREERIGMEDLKIKNNNNIIMSNSYNVREVKELILKVIRMFKELDLYIPLFEKFLIQHSNEYYDKSSKLMFQKLILEDGNGFGSVNNSNNVSKYLYDLENSILKSEKKRFLYFKFLKSTQKKIISIIYTYYLKRYANRLLNQGFPVFIERIKRNITEGGMESIGFDVNEIFNTKARKVLNKDEGDLRRLYLFFEKLEYSVGMNELKKLYEEKIIELGDDLVKDYELTKKREKMSDEVKTPMTPLSPLPPFTPSTPSTPKPPQNSNRKTPFVEDLAILKLLLERIERICFYNNKLFKNCIRTNFIRFLNTNQQLSNAISLLLARQINIILSKRGESTSSSKKTNNIIDGFNSNFGVRMSSFIHVDEIFDEKELLEVILNLFQFLETKDLFEQAYKMYLANRLLLKYSKSIELEKFMIMKLKAECGSAFTNQLDGMFRDLETSKGIIEKYNQNRTKHFDTLNSDSKFNEMELKMVSGKKSAFSFSVAIIKIGHFPNMSLTEDRGSNRKSGVEMVNQSFIYPRVVDLEKRIFEEFYSCQFSSRKLKWQPNFSQVSLRALFRRGNKELLCSAYQAVILFAFNQNPTGEDTRDTDNIFTLTNDEIEKITGIQDFRILYQQLFSLGTKKVQLLYSKRMKNGPKNGRIFKINKEFHHNMTKIKVNSIQKKMIRVRDRDVEERAFISRDVIIDAAIVRIMKARKSLKHEKLVQETLCQVMRKFRASVKDIKKRIESLIDRDYMKRNEDGKSYSYVA